ncbi:hypothetical protein HPG69_016250 [Diceros bicornis minor]|uniref:Uncharacterized protein n=1 Tax=Diceros bicornis minor TaxID=77932 RepID=A0A7J7EL88_DICBM|nr:hypothetical protein HPG69_016250 [Diceros bicornis minor]
MHAGRQSARAGAGPPRAVAKLGLLNCYYSGGLSEPSLASVNILGQARGVRPAPIGPGPPQRPPPEPQRRPLLAAPAAARPYVSI